MRDDIVKYLKTEVRNRAENLEMSTVGRGIWQEN